MQSVGEWYVPCGVTREDHLENIITHIQRVKAMLEEEILEKEKRIEKLSAEINEITEYLEEKLKWG